MRSLSFIAFFILSLAVLSSCEHDVATETTVYPDGSLDKSITVEAPDSAKSAYYFFYVGYWDMKEISVPGTGIDSTKSMKIFRRYSKKFASAEEANLVTVQPSDTLFHISSKFEKKFKWFYTYISFSDTYHAINRLKLPVENYITAEDYSFIERLPSQGKKISLADSLYLAELNKKIFDIYGLRGLFEAYWNININLIMEYKLEQEWFDVLDKHKEEAFAMMTSEDEDKLMDDFFMLNYMERLHIPLPYEALRTDYLNRIKPLDRITNFMSSASEGNFTHRINLPWSVVKSNADSVSGKSLFWAPPTIKFLLKDYTMYGECRKLNWWAVIVSVLIVGFTGYLFVRKRSS
jgi:hypothetical protein